MNKLFRSLATGAALVLFSVSAQAGLLYDFQWTGNLKITGFSDCAVPYVKAPPGFPGDPSIRCVRKILDTDPGLENPEGDIYTTRFEWTINPGSTSFIGIPDGTTTTTTGSLVINGVGAGLLPIGIVTEIGDFLALNGYTGNFAALPTVSAPPAAGVPFTLPLDEFPFNSDLVFTSIASTPTSLIYEITETNPTGTSTLAATFHTLDGSVTPPPNGIISRPFELSAQVTQVPEPATLGLLMLGMVGVYRFSRQKP